MAAGLGFKDFTTGEVLTAADVDGYLMQGIWVFASAAARDAAVTSPQEGNFAFLKDTNTTTYYTGSAWTNLDTTGMVNPMTTTGDTIYSSSGSTPARLGIGTAGQVLTVNSGATAPEWATPAAAGGGFTQLASGSLSGSTVSLSAISGSYIHLYLQINDYYPSSNGALIIRPNGDSTGYLNWGQGNSAGTYYTGTISTDNLNLSDSVKNSDNNNTLALFIYDYTNTVAPKLTNLFGKMTNDGNNTRVYNNGGYTNGNTAITSIDIIAGAGTFSGGTYKLYGVK